MAERGSVFNCSICLNAFKNPKLLPCSHTFCNECLELYIETSSTDKKFNCPLCRKYLEVPENGTSGFPANHYILMSTEVSPDDKCLVCDCSRGKNDSVFRCLECDEIYCKTCIVVHQKSKASRDHEILEITKENGHTETRIRRKTFCSVHDEEIVFDCDCNVQICVHCKLTDHHNHTTKSIAVTACQVREQIEEVLLSDRRKSTELRLSSHTQNCRSIQQELDQIEERELNKIDRRALGLKDEIDQICTEMKTRLKTRVYEERQHIQEKEQLASGRLLSFEHLCSTADRMVKIVDDIDVVTLGRALCKNMEDCFADDGSNNDTEIQLPHIEFKEGEKKHKSVRSAFGGVSIWKKPKLVSSISLGGQTDIWGLCPMDDGTCWIANQTNILSLIDSTCRVIKTVTSSYRISGLAPDVDGSMFICSYVDKIIQKNTTHDGNVNVLNVCSSLQFMPIDMAVNHVTDDLIVTSHTGVYAVSRDGSVKELKIDFTDFAKCFGVAIDDAGTVCISDWGNRIVTFFDYQGRKKATYTGNKNAPFEPNGVCSDQHGNYFVADCHAKLIHILRSDGSLEYCFSTHEDVDNLLITVASGTQDHLWVGFDGGIVCVYELGN